MSGLDCKSILLCSMSLVFSKYRLVCHVPSRNVPTHNDPKNIVPNIPMVAVGDGGGGSVVVRGGRTVLLLMLLLVVVEEKEEEEYDDRCIRF